MLGLEDGLTTGSFAATAGGCTLATGFPVVFWGCTGGDDLVFGCMTNLDGGGAIFLAFGAIACGPAFLPVGYPVGMALSAARRRATTTELDALVSATFFAKGKEC